MRPLVALRISGLLLPLLAAATFSAISHSLFIQRATQQANDTARIVREHALRVFEAQRTAIDVVDAKLAGISWDEIEASQTVHNMLRQVAHDSPHIEGLWLIRPDGRTASSADYFPMPEAWTNSREYFQVLKERDTLHIGEVIVGNLKGNLNFNLSRRRSSEDGSFNGVILLTIGMEYFEEFWRGILRSDSHIAGMLREDGAILVRYPPLQTPPLKIPAQSPFFQVIKKGSGAYEFRSASDGKLRIYGIEKLGPFPIFAFIGLDRWEILKTWRENSAILAVVALLASGILFSLVRMAERREERALAETMRREQAEEDVMRKADHIAALREAHTALEASHVALRDSETRFRVAQELSLDAFTILRAVRDTKERIVDFEWIYANPSACQILKQTPSDLMGHRLLEVLPGNGGPGGLFEKYVAVVETGNPHDIELCYENDGISGWFRNVTVKLGDGIAVYFSDITERKRAQSKQTMLMSELDHRVKNMLSITQSIARQSIKGNADDYARFSGRFRALIDTHKLLSEHQWEAVDFRRAVEMALAAYSHNGERHFTSDGPDFSVSPRIAQSIVLILHELATNAFKYGALSSDGGYIKVDWNVVEGDQPRLSVRWREHGGPPVNAPQRTGFGTKFVQHAVAHDLRGVATFSYLPDGLAVDFSFPIDPASVSLGQRELAL